MDSLIKCEALNDDFDVYQIKSEPSDSCLNQGSIKAESNSTRTKPVKKIKKEKVPKKKLDLGSDSDSDESVAIEDDSDCPYTKRSQ